MPERKRVFFGIIVLIVACCGANARPGPGRFQKTADGILVFPDTTLTGHVKLVKLQVISDHIIRVIASPTAQIPARESLIIMPRPVIKEALWEVQEEKEEMVELRTRALTVQVCTATGAVTFRDTTGNVIVQERGYNGRSLTPATYEGEALWQVRQTFETAPDDAFYGLGQHQEDVMNYKGEQVQLFQNNTEVAVPFMVSRKHYGILWDNYSISTVGDIRPYEPLTALKLYAVTGEEGWLTASYRNDHHATKVDFQKAESVIDYPYLGDTREKLPAAFKPATGSVTWEGAMAADRSGIYHFKISYGGYLKIWIDGKLQTDRWRQAWNPGAELLEITLKKGEKHPVKIEWVPDGTESYLSVKCQSPAPEKDAHTFSFSSEAGSLLDYYFIYGEDMDGVISGYRSLTGKAPIVPQWAMGLWQSRERYKTGQELLDVVQEFRKRQIPLDNIVQDWSYWKEDDWGSQEFDNGRFPDPAAMINRLHQDYHTRLMISVWPKFYEGIDTYKQFMEKGWLYRRNIADRQRDWIGKGYVSTFYDAFNRQAQQGFWNLLNDKLYSKGIDAWWMDASEPDILSNVSPAKRKEQMTPTALGPAAAYLNAYPLENARGIYEGQRSVNPDQRVFILTRSGFAGSQRFAAAIWSGDIAARWHDMKDQIAAGINFSLSGIPYWTMDIGGFAVEKRYEHPNAANLEEWREQMTRWFQFGAFCPLFRVHGQFPYREIFNTAPDDHPAYKSMLYYDKLRYRLLPYIYSLAGMTYHKDYTIMRGLVMDFDTDTAVNDIGDQYMFGPSLLINPVYHYGDRKRTVYLPAGQGWYDLNSGRYFAGGQHITMEAPYERMPVLVKAGSILPWGPALQYTAEKKPSTITLYVYTGKDARFTLYEDEGTNYNYEQGHYSLIPLHYDDATHTLAIGSREGSFAGMLTKRTFNVVWITPHTPATPDKDPKPAATVTYTGKPIQIHMK